MSDPAPAERSIVNRATGEVIDLDASSEDLARWQYDLSELARQLRSLGDLIDAELRARMGDRMLWPVGAFEVSVGRESAWDWDELETVLRDLVDTGQVHAADVTDVIRHETVGSRREAGRLAKRLTGPGRAAVERCCTWRQRGGRLRIAPTVQLVEETPE